MMAIFSFCLILSGDLVVILEFGSVTFLLVSMLMAYANFRIRELTNSSLIVTLISLFGLFGGTIAILYYETTTKVDQVYYIGGLYVILTVLAFAFTYKRT